MLNNIPYQPQDKECHALCMKLLKAKREGMDMATFLSEIAHIATTYGFDELRPLSEPICPVTLINYHNLSMRDKNNVNSGFWEDPEIKLYLHTLHKAKNITQANREWLEELLTYTKDDVVITRIKNRLGEFSAVEPLDPEEKRIMEMVDDQY